MKRKTRSRGTRLWWAQAVHSESGQYGARTAAYIAWTGSCIAASLTAASVDCPRWQKTLWQRLAMWYASYFMPFLYILLLPDLIVLILRYSPHFWCIRQWVPSVVFCQHRRITPAKTFSADVQVSPSAYNHCGTTYLLSATRGGDQEIAAIAGDCRHSSVVLISWRPLVVTTLVQLLFAEVWCSHSEYHPSPFTFICLM